MTPPNLNFKVRDIANLVGPDIQVEVLEVANQSEKSMTLGEWADYFEDDKAKEAKILNVCLCLSKFFSSKRKEGISPLLNSPYLFIGYLFGDFGFEIGQRNHKTKVCS